MKLKLLGLLFMAALGASASTFTVSNSGSTFTIRRSGEGTNAAETVHYRTVPLTAFPGQHFTAASGALVFAPGQTSTNVVVSERSPSSPFNYQTASSRAYRLQILDPTGTNLVYYLRSRSVGSAVGSTLFAQKSATIDTTEFTVTDSGYHQTGNPHTFNVSSFYDSDQRSYLSYVSAQLHATLEFQSKEVEDGYQYLQVLVDNTTGYDSKNDADKGDPGTPTLSSYMAGFEMNTGSADTTYRTYSFPVTSVGSDEGASNPWGYSSDGKYPLSKQKFNTNCRASDGKIVVSNGFSTLSVRFDASGSNNDNWMAKNLVAKFTAHESTKPYIRSGIVVAPGPYRHGTEFYVSVPFSEIVTTSGTPKLHTSWGDLSCLSTSDSNVLTFKGTIAADVDTPLVIRCISGTVTDLAGNALTGTNVNANLSCTVGYPWPGAGTEQDAYVITTAAQLDYLAARVNAGTWFTNTCFELGADIAYSHAATDWDTITSSGDGENNFTPIGCYGKPFKGHFDGKGHTVSGIRVFKEDNDDTDHSDESLGLFGFVSDGTVKNVFLRDANIHGKRNLGGIVGYLSGGVVTNCLLYNVRVSTGSTRFNVYVDVGYNSGTIDGNRYRDCCIGQKPAQASGELINVRQDNLFAVAPADDVAAAFASGESAAIDGTNYYTAGSAFALSYTGAVPANWSVVYAATGGATVNGSTLTLASADATVSASVAPPADYAAHWQAGADHDGTSAKPYVITTPEGLQLLSAEVNAGTSFSGTYFQLDADIDMGAVANFEPIGRYDSKPFAGNFNGDGYTIRNLTVNIADNTYAGLFGRVLDSVANLTLGDSTITGYNFTGGIVGSLYAIAATLDNCHVVRSVITGVGPLHNVGAIVGTLSGTATGCTYHSTIVRAPNDTGGEFHADGGDAFNTGAGLHYSPVSGSGDILGASFDPSCLLLPTNAPAFRAALIAAYSDPVAHTARGGDAPDLSGLVVTSGVTRLYAVTNATPAGLSVSGTDVVLAGLGRSYFAPGDTVALVPPAGFAIVSASYDDGAAHDILYADGAFSFTMPAADVSVAATLAPASGFCGRADANGGENVVWSFDPATGALAVTTNAAAVGTDFSMADYEWNALDDIPWAVFKPYIASIFIAPGVASVGDYAFYDCTALDFVSIGGDVSGIGESAFQTCAALEAVFIPESVTSIGNYAFLGCTALATVEGGANVTRVGFDAFGSLGGGNAFTTQWLRAQPAGVVYLGKVAIAFQSGADTDVEIAAGTVSIAPWAFDNSPVTSVVIPESVVHIGEQAFAYCDNLDAAYLLSAAPPAFDDPDYLFAREGLYPDPDLLFYVRGTAYADAWSDVWDYMANNSNWTDANRIVIGTVSCTDGITAAGTPVLACGGTNYYAAGSTITLAGVPPAPDPVPAGYTDQLAGYAVNGLIGGGLFTMPEGDAVVTPRWAAADFETGHAGTEQDPYVIYNKDQLDLLAARVNGGKTYNGKVIRLGADIAYDPTALDENGENYTAIGGYHDGGIKSFRGTFDGVGHTVRGIRINKTGDSNADSYQGLFGEVDNGTIRNVTLADSVIVGNIYVGGIAGQHDNGALANCRVEESVTIGAGCNTAHYHGGIVGSRWGTIDGCFSAATVTSSGKTYCSFYGGIVGSQEGIIRDCLALGSAVTADGSSGAILGRDLFGSASFTNNYYAACTVNGTTNATNVGCGNPAGDQDGARLAHTITLGPGVRIVGEETIYSNSCLTAIGTSALRYVTGAGTLALRSLGEGGTNLYSGAGQTITLAFTGVLPEGYAFVGFAVNGVAIDGDTFAMPDADATVTVRALSPWAQLQAEIDAADGGTVVLDRDYAAAEGDATLTVTNAVTLDLAGHTIDAKGRFGVIEIDADGDLTLTNSVPGSGAITGGGGNGGVTICGGTFTMTGGEISGNAAELFGGGVFLASGSLEVSGSPVVAGNTNSFGAPVNVFLYGGMITAGDLAAGAAIGVSSYTLPIFGGTTIATGATADDAAYFFSDSPNYHVEFANDELRLVGGTVYPVYLAGADDVVTNNWFDWARKYGANTNAEYEAAFLLDIDPATPIPAGASMLKIVELGTTNILMSESGDYGELAQDMGYTGDYLAFRRIVLASDVAELWQRDDWDTPYEICNGYLVLRITGDLSLPKSEWQAISWFMEFKEGRAEIIFPEFLIHRYIERVGGKAVSGLFLKACIETKPALEFFENLGLLIAEP
jgi:hypothetical protein